MKIESSAFIEGGMIPSKFTCDDKDISPDLHWDDVPESTKSFALICDDPDAPMGTWVHWLVCNIPSNVRDSSENSIIKGSLQIRNDFGKKNYGGPCPPSGIHRYFFKLYALDVEKLENVDKGNFYQLVDEHKISMTQLMGKYSRR